MEQATTVTGAGSERAGQGPTVGRLFNSQAAARGSEIAIRQGSTALTFAELLQRVNRAANAMASRGVRHGDRVAILSENRFEYIEVILAAAKLGVIVANQNWRQSDAELRHCVELSGPVLIFASERYADVAARVVAGRSVVAFGADYEAFCAAAGTSEPADVSMPEDGLLILYTSGTTGLPKGALLSHRAVIARTMTSRLDGGLFPEGATIIWTPLFHMAASDPAIGMLISGGRINIVDGFDLDRIVEIIMTEEIGNLMLMPATIDKFMQAVRADGRVPKAIKVVGCMADLVPHQQLIEVTTLLQARYRNTFGATETGPVPCRGLIPIGRVPDRMSKQQSSFCDVRLVDPDDNEVPDGTPGEMTLRSATLFSGYWNNPEATARDFRGGWFHMGDMFVRNPDRTLDFVDRVKYLIKSGGENIYPAEIERCLLASPRVADAVVVRKPDSRWGEIPVAFVARADATLDAEAVVDMCRGQIAKYKLPKEVHFIAEADLPRSTTGKIIRHELEQRLT